MDTGNLLSALRTDTYQKVSTYYDIAGPDYASWSKEFNMHFGYCKSFANIFFLEKMLRNMNELVLGKLDIDTAKPCRIADLGCGVATVARHAAKKFPLSEITAVTISRYQLQKGNALSIEQDLAAQVKIVNENFEQLSFTNESFYHAYAIESACHANGAGKDLFVAEMARILKPGGTFCIADGFLKHDRKLPRFFNYLYQKIIRFWALPCFGNINEFKNNLEKNGLKNIEIKEISLRIAPSVAYVPWTCVKFFAKEIWRNKSLRMKKERWNNVYAPVLGMILGLYRRHFGYYIITGTK